MKANEVILHFNVMNNQCQLTQKPLQLSLYAENTLLIVIMKERSDFAFSI